MTDAIFLSTQELCCFLATLPVLLFMFIYVSKNLSRLVPASFDFSSRYFLLGISIAMSCAIAFLNWQIEEKNLMYEVVDLGPETLVMDMPVTIQKEEIKKTPPPVKPKKVKKIIDLIKLNLVEDLVEKIEEPEIVDTQNDDYLTPVAIESDPAPIVAPVVEELEEEPFIFIAEQMPRFPGCEDMEGTNKEKENCSKLKLLNFIATNLKYPSIARENRVEGLAVLRFIVTKKGKIEDVKIIREIGAGCGKAALEVVKSMNELPESWTPGKQRGRPVNVQYTLPVKFKLN